MNFIYFCLGKIIDYFLKIFQKYWLCYDPLLYIINNKDNRFILENFVGRAIILESKFYDPSCYLNISKSKMNFQRQFLVTGRYKHCDYRWTSFFQHCIKFVHTQKWDGQTLQSLYVYEIDQKSVHSLGDFPTKRYFLVLIQLKISKEFTW